MSAEFLDKLPTQSRNNIIKEEEDHFCSGMVLTRHHIYSTYNRNGYEAACDVLNKHYIGGDLEESQYTGLVAELRFYADFKSDLQLVPALDCGDNVDFVGFYQGHYIRFDVTINIGCKSYSNYTKCANHIIAVWSESDSLWSYYVPSGNASTGFVKVR